MKNNLIALNENELNEVTGGVNLKEVRDTAIIATCTTVGSVLGDIASTFITTGINVVGHHCEILEDNSAELYLLDKHGRKKIINWPRCRFDCRRSRWSSFWKENSRCFK